MRFVITLVCSKGGFDLCVNSKRARNSLDAKRLFVEEIVLRF